VHPEGFATHGIPPGIKPGPEVHVSAPHPDPVLRALGWRIAFVFFALIAGLACMMMAMPIPWEALLSK
jgi:hypothetical protein